MARSQLWGRQNFSLYSNRSPRQNRRWSIPPRIPALTQVNGPALRLVLSSPIWSCQGRQPCLQFRNERRVTSSGTTVWADDVMQVQTCHTRRWRSPDRYGRSDLGERPAGWKGTQARWRWDGRTGSCASCWNHADLPRQNSTTVCVHVWAPHRASEFLKKNALSFTTSLETFILPQDLLAVNMLASFMQSCYSLQYVTISGSNEVYGRYRKRPALLPRSAIITSGSRWHP